MLKVVLLADDRLPSIQADRAQIEQVIINLAVNARDAMPTGGTLTIETRTLKLDESYASQHLEVQAGRYVGLTVTDTGTGTDPEVSAHLAGAAHPTHHPRVALANALNVSISVCGCSTASARSPPRPDRAPRAPDNHQTLALSARAVTRARVIRTRSPRGR